MPVAEILAKFWPLIALQVVLMIVALLDIRKRSTFRYLPRGMWIAIVIVIQTLGPISYFAFGRGEE